MLLMTGDYFLCQACADKLRMEMEDFGYPPIFHDTEDIGEHKIENVENEPVIKDKAKGKKVNNYSVFSLHYILISICWHTS